MPERPPKEWFDRTVRSLSRDPDIDDPKALAGWIWHYGLRSGTRRRILSRERAYEPRRLDQQIRERLSLRRKVRHGMYDPQALPPPIDFHGYDNLNLVRVVPEIDQLIEGMIVLPQHQFDDLKDIVKDFEDVELTDRDTMLIRRGAKNAATNLFIQRATGGE